mmetsp:Transcript_88415/g.249133  ORF Transcript_88415/g.249133 Transcript_88415/m.249133 type:complete len:325 (+) Transcript_88415:404-1378(+)
MGLVVVHVHVARIGVLTRRNTTLFAHLLADLQHKIGKDSRGVLKPRVTIGAICALLGHIPGRLPWNAFWLHPHTLLHVRGHPLATLLGREGLLQYASPRSALLVLNQVFPHFRHGGILLDKSEGLLHAELFVKCVRPRDEELPRRAFRVAACGNDFSALALLILRIHDGPTILEKHLNHLIGLLWLRRVASRLRSGEMKQRVSLLVQELRSLRPLFKHLLDVVHLEVLDRPCELAGLIRGHGLDRSVRPVELRRRQVRCLFFPARRVGLRHPTCGSGGDAQRSGRCKPPSRLYSRSSSRSLPGWPSGDAPRRHYNGVEAPGSPH